MPLPTAFQDNAFQNDAVLGLPDAFQVGALVRTSPQNSIGGGGGGGSWRVDPLNSNLSSFNPEGDADYILDIAHSFNHTRQYQTEKMSWQEENDTAKTRVVDKKLTEDQFLLFIAFNQALILKQEHLKVIKECLGEEEDTVEGSIPSLIDKILKRIGFRGKSREKAKARVHQCFDLLKAPEIRDSNPQQVGDKTAIQVEKHIVYYPVPREDKPDRFLSPLTASIIGAGAGLIIAYAFWYFYLKDDTPSQPAENELEEDDTR